jgi:streptogramin lyase
MNGKVQSGGSHGDIRALGYVDVVLCSAADNGMFIGPVEMTDSRGWFQLEASTTSTPGTFLVLAERTSKTPMMALLGPELPDDIVINELTTVAAVYCAAQFVRGTPLGIFGPSSGVRVAAAMSTNIADVRSGDFSQILTNSPNADQTNGLRLTASLANLLAWCVRDSRNCDAFFDLTTPPGGQRPANLVEALLNIAHYPANQVAALYEQSQRVPQVYSPALTSQPDAWTLAVKVNDSGDTNNMYGGPANLAFDREGRAWITNNVIQGSGASTEYCIVLDAAGRPAVENGRKLSPFTGGGLLGAAYGVALDSQENVWIGNFGWGNVFPAPAGSVSQFTSSAVAMSPDKTSSSYTGGYQTGNFWRVQATVIDDHDNVWIAGWGSHTVAVLTNVTAGRDGIRNPIVYDPGDETFMPFGIAMASDGTAWVVNANSTQSGLVQLQLDTTTRELTAISSPPPFGKTAKGIAIDSLGNIWVASGGDGYVYAFTSDGTSIGRYNTGAIDGPWGVAVDGNDNIWVANFGLLSPGTFTGRLTHLAGANEATRPTGTSTGDVLSPYSTGYTLPNQGDEILLADLTPLYGDQGPAMYIPFMRVTAVNFDAAGNIWCCNNWKPDFLLNLVGDPLKDEQANPGGDGMVIFVGMAKPRGC